MSETITQHLVRTKGDPHGIAGYTGDVFCHLLEEVMPNGEKGCAINDPRWIDA